MSNYHCKESNLNNLARSNPIPFLFLIILLIFGSVSNIFSNVVIDDGFLDKGGGACEFDLPTNRTFTVKLTDPQILADWQLLPSGQDTNIAGSGNNRSSVVIQVGETPNVYTLTADDNGDDDFITIVVGESARIVSYIGEIPDSDWNPSHPDYTGDLVAAIASESNNLDLPQDDVRIRESIEALDLVDNPFPPDQFADDNAWGAYIGQRQHRGWIHMQPAAIFDSNGDPRCSSLIRDDLSEGFTPAPENIFRMSEIILGNGCLQPPQSESSGEGNGREEQEFVLDTFDEEVTWTWHHQMRVNPASSGGMALACVMRLNDSMDIPFVWQEIKYIMRPDGDFEVIYGGSDFPSHFAYLGGDKIDQHVQTNLAENLFIGPNEAEGGDFHSSKTGTFSTYVETQQILPGNTPLELTVPESLCITDANVTLYLKHNAIQNLSISLRNEDIQSFLLKDLNGVAGSNLFGTTFDDQANLDFNLDGSSPFRDEFLPSSPLSTVNKDYNENIDWTLDVLETGTFDGSSRLQGFSLALNSRTHISRSPFVPATVNFNTTGDVLLEILSSESQLINDLDISMLLSHNKVDQLTGVLISPNGTTVELFSNVDPSGKDGFRFTSFDDEALVAIEDAENDFSSGRYKTEQDTSDGKELNEFDGESSGGLWTLRIANSGGGEANIDAFWINISGADVNEPDSDNCDGAFELILDDETTFDTFGATGGDPSPICVPMPIKNDVWFFIPETTITSCTDVEVTISLASGSNLAFMAYESSGSGPCGANLDAPIACELGEMLVFTPNSGMDYYVRVGSTTGEVVSGTLTVSCLVVEPPSVGFVLSAQAVQENPVSVPVNVVLNIPGGGMISDNCNVDVLINTDDPKSATIGVDYTTMPTLPTTLTFPAGSGNGDTQPVMVEIMEEEEIEFDETVVLMLANFTGHAVSGDFIEHTLTIENDDDSSPPLLTVESPTNGETIPSSSVTVLGTASDPESGISKVEVSLDGNPPVLASGTMSWSIDFDSLVDGLHTFVATATNGDGSSTDAPEVSITVNQINGPIEWIEEKNVEIINGNTITKNSGAENGWDAGAISKQPYGNPSQPVNVAVHTIVADTEKLLMFGLNSGGNEGESFVEIDYAIYLLSYGRLQIRHAGTPAANVGSCNIGDKLTIEINDGNVLFYKSTLTGTEFGPPELIYYIPGVVKAQDYPFIIDCSLRFMGATLQDVRVSDPDNKTIEIPNEVPGSVVWSTPQNVTVIKNKILKPTNATEGWNSGAISEHSYGSQLAPTNVAVNCAVEQGMTTQTRMFGLSSAVNSGTIGDDGIDFAFRLNNDSTLEIYENGMPVVAFGRYNVSDILTVEINGNHVCYRVNGIMVHATMDAVVAADYPFVLDASIYTPGGGLSLMTVSRPETETPLSGPVVGTEQDVEWTGEVLVGITGNTITKDSGTAIAWDAGAFSTQIFGSGEPVNVAAHTIIEENNTSRFFGLNSGGSGGSSYFEIEYSFYILDRSTLSVRHLGGYYPVGTYQNGDKLTVEINEGYVFYRINDLLVLYFENVVQPNQYPFIVDTSIKHPEGTLKDVTVTTSPLGN